MTIVVTALVSQYRFVRLATVTRIVSSGRIVQSLLEQLRKKIQNEIGRLVPLKYGVPRTADLAISETPKVGTVDDWVYIKTTGDTHPMHMHLVTFQVVDPTPFDAEAYEEAYGIRTASQAGIDPTPFATGPAIPAAPEERGFKDTVKVNPGYFTRIRAKFELPTGVTVPQNQHGGAAIGEPATRLCHIDRHPGGILK